MAGLKLSHNQMQTQILGALVHPNFHIIYSATQMKGKFTDQVVAYN